MNKFKNATKRIAAVAASAVIVSSAAFAGLGNYPSNFVENGKFVGQVVVGAEAAASDVTAAEAIIADLAAEFSGESDKVQITYRTVGSGKSIEVSSSNDDLNYGEALNGAETDFDEDNFPSLLADGVINDDDYEDEEYDYEQEIVLSSDPVVTFGRDYDMDDETDVPEIFFDLGAGSGVLYTLKVDFKDTLVAADTVADEEDEGLANSESIDLFGKTFTFDPNNDESDDLVLFASSNIVTATQGQKVTVESDGDTYEVEVIGANSDDSTATLSVNGITKSVTEGDNTAIAGLDVYVDEVFISNVGGDSAAVKLFLGSDEVVIPMAAQSGFTEIEVDGDEIAGYEVQATGNWSALEALEFRFTPKDLDEEIEYLRVGESIVDPLFGTLTVEFEGASDDFDAGNMVTVERSSDDAVLSFTNRDGEEYSFEVFTGNAVNAVAHDDMWTAANYTDVTEDKLVILQEDTGATDFVTKVYQVSRVYTEDGDDKVELQDLADGSKTSYELGDEVDDTGAYVRDINTTGDHFDLYDDAVAGLNTTSIFTLYTENDVRIVLDLANDGNLTFTENMDDNIDETADVNAATLVLDMSSDSDDDIKLSVSGLVNVDSSNDEDNDYEFGLSEMGSYFVLEVDQNGEDFVLYTPIEELDYKVNFIAGSVGESNIKTVDADSVDEEVAALEAAGFEVVSTDDVAAESAEFDVTAPMYDNEVSGSEDMIVVGGPAVNAVARALLGIETYSIEQAGVAVGEAKAQYFADLNTVLVYGYDAADTTAMVEKLNAGTANIE